jgi:hypothetical protein
MFPVVFLSLAFSVLVTVLVGLAMFLEVAFSSEVANAHQRATNEVRNRSAKKEQTAVNGPLRPASRTVLARKPNPFRPKRTQSMGRRQTSHVSKSNPNEMFATK